MFILLPFTVKSRFDAPVFILCMCHGMSSTALKTGFRTGDMRHVYAKNMPVS